MIDLKPDQRTALAAEYTAHKKALKDASVNLLAAALNLVPTSPVTSTPNNSILSSDGTNSNVSSSAGASRMPHSYQREKLPVFTGELRAYPRWSRQWKDAQSYFGEDQFFMMLQSSTPTWVDILSNSSLAEVWEQLDARFASTRVVSEAALKDYQNYVPAKKSKNERLIEVAEHVSRTYRDLQSVGKEQEMDQVEHLILKVLDWLDSYHKDELVDLLMKDEKALPAQRVGTFKLIFNYLKTTRMNLLKYHTFTADVEKTETKTYCRVCKRTHPLPYCRPKSGGLNINNQERQPGGQGASRGGGRGQTSPPENCKFCGKKSHSFTSTRTNKTYPSSRLYDCPDFMRLDETARAEYLEKHKGCSVCTNPYHQEATCNSTWQKCGAIISGDTKCPERHNRVLHGANSSYVITNNLVQINNVKKGLEQYIEPRPVLLFIQSVMLRGRVLGDGGN
ncbi:MAG: hypothetical protein GY737_11720 [Desulfobacteraceae bacterium]|nr:hypothetical protein [Desulfobacteraceae bacterium]